MKERIIAYGVTGLVCFTILMALLFAALWQWKEFVGWTFLGLLILFALLGKAWVINELFLRHKRYQYREEVPVSFQQTGTPSAPQGVYPVQPNQFYTPSEANSSTGGI
jgi:hypothetical protein